MKRLIRLVSTLAVAGLAFAYTGCTDYSEDVNRLDERIDGQIATTEEQYKKLQEEDGKLQAAIDAANTSIKALQDNTASLQDELTALKTKHEADIKAVNETHAADKAALEAELGKKADQTALDNLDTKYANEISKLDEAYKQADSEIKGLIAENTARIGTLESTVKNINDVVIPAVKKQISDLETKADATYATKTALTDSTAKVTALVKTEVGTLNKTLEGIESRLSTVEAAHKTLKESFEETKVNHESRIANLETKLAALEKTHTDDVTALKDSIGIAKEAAAAAAKAASAAQTAADNAQTTANKAVADAAAAAKAAKDAKDIADEALGKVNTLIEALKIYDEEGNVRATIEDLLAADAGLAARLAACETNDSKLAADLTALKASVKHKIDSLAEVINGQLTGINEELGKKFDADKFASSFNTEFENYIKDGKFDTAFGTAFSKVLNEAFGDATLKGALDKYLETAFDGENYSAAISAGIKAALAAAEDGKPAGVIAEAINKEVSAARTALETKISETQKDLDSRIDKVAEDIVLVIGDLAKRIQSVTFVPEYNDMCASLYYYYIWNDNDGKAYPISNKKTVVAKFEVYPRTQAQNVVDMLNGNNGASIVAVPLKHSYTRSASIFTAEKVTAKLTGNGVINVEAVFSDDLVYELDWHSYANDKDVDYDHANTFAIALRVEAPAEDEIVTGKDEDGKVISTTVDAGKYIESAYVPVEIARNCELYLDEAFELRNKETGELFDHENVLTHKEQWSADPSNWNYLKDYEYVVNVAARGESSATYKTLAVAAEIIGVEVADITPEFKVAATPDKGKKDFFKPVADSKGFVTFENVLTAPMIEMNHENVVAAPKNAVGSKMAHKVTFSLKGVENVIKPVNATYEIGRREITFDVTPYDYRRIEWTYKKAKELTTASGIANGKPYDKSITFNECYVTKRDNEGEDQKVTLGEVLNNKKITDYEVTINGEVVKHAATPIKITKVADQVEDVAKVVIPGGTYKFANRVDNNYVIKTIYGVDENMTDYIVSFKYTLGKMAEDQIVTLPAKTFKFNSKDPSFKESYSEAEYLKPLVDAIGGYFADAKTLWASVNEDKVVKTEEVKAVIDGKKDPSFPATSVTTINVTNDGVNVVVDRSDLKTFEDTFYYEATRKTWYGVKYTFKTASALEFEDPDFMLAPAPDRLDVNDWTGTILPEAKYDKYVLKQDIDLSKYVIVVGLDGKQKEITEDKLTIRYAQKTKADVANGIVNVPSIVTTPVKVIPNVAAPQYPTIESSLISWLKNPRADSFTACYDEIGATLYLDDIKLGDEKVMKLSTARPIKNFAFDPFVVTVPAGSTGEKVELWNNMIIEGVLEEGNIVKQDAKSLTGVLISTGTVKGKKTNPWTYDCEVIFPETKDVEVYVGGEKQSIYNLEKFTYDNEKGIITFTGDLSDLVNYVEFKFTAKLNYVLDYVHVKQLEAKVSVTFQK